MNDHLHVGWEISLDRSSPSPPSPSLSPLRLSREIGVLKATFLIRNIKIMITLLGNVAHFVGWNVDFGKTNFSSPEASHGCLDCFVVILFSCYLSECPPSDNNSNKVYVPRHKHVLGSSQSQLNPGLTALNKMTLIWPKTYILIDLIIISMPSFCES